MNQKVIFAIIILALIFILPFVALKIYHDQITSNIEDYSTSNSTNTIEPEPDFSTRIVLTVNGLDFLITLEDNPTSRALYQKLPLEITMSDLTGEKYYYFSAPLPNNPTKVQSVNAGDLMLFEDNCLVLFYESSTTPYEYTYLGKIDHPAPLLNSIDQSPLEVKLAPYPTK